VSEVRSGTGVLTAIQLSAERMEEDPSLLGKVVAACRGAGILTRALVPGALQISPALVIDREGLAELASGIAAALEAVT
jgi:adenosylmethionine-8-amino-7-oxononanoate aminotransferase